ncbi:MAG: GEVED domain-containing protein, partial [Bacteroidia bacterium]
GLPVWLNGNLPTSFNSNYNTGGVYYISFQQCNSFGVGIGTEYGKWLTLAESTNLEKLDGRAIAASLGLNFTVNNYYRIKLGTGGVGWTDHIKRIQVVSCTNSVEFSVNGEFRTNFTPINISYSDAEPPVMIDASLTQNCSGAYWLSVEPCLANGDGSANGNSDEYGAWLNSTETASLSNFDIRSFLTSRFSQQINYGQHYRIKLMTGGNNAAKVVIINVQACTNNADFKINDQSRTDFTPVIIPPGESVFMFTQPATICNDDYYLSVEPCNAMGDGSANGNADEVGQWMSYNNMVDKFDIQELINVSAFYQSNSPNSLPLQPGSYYRVKLGTAGVWSGKVIIIYMQPNYCVSSGIVLSTTFIARFEINGFPFESGDNNGYRDYTDHGLDDKENYVPKLNYGSTVMFNLHPNSQVGMKYWRIWIDYNNDSQFQASELICQSSNSAVILNFTHTVPSDVPLGKKRMRVSMKKTAF